MSEQDSWEDRMAQRAADRRLQLDEANRREDAWLPQTLLHGTMTACPCGAEVGTVPFAIISGYVQDYCGLCGKPTSAHGDGQPWQKVPKHVIGCPERPDTVRCTTCGQPFLGTMVIGNSSGTYHLGCYD